VMLSASRCAWANKVLLREELPTTHLCTTPPTTHESDQQRSRVSRSCLLIITTPADSHPPTRLPLSSCTRSRRCGHVTWLSHARCCDRRAHARSSEHVVGKGDAMHPMYSKNISEYLESLGASTSQLVSDSSSTSGYVFTLDGVKKLRAIVVKHSKSNKKSQVSKQPLHSPSFLQPARAVRAHRA
jgi:hypothetical protein